MTTILPLGPKYEDTRGIIQMILEDISFRSSSIISSKKGTTRASHWHKEDSHYCLVLAGEIAYFERLVGSQDKPVLTVVKEGKIFYTPPMVEHEMFFTEDTAFLCFSTLSRANANYESDTTRLDKKLKDIYDTFIEISS